MVTMDFNTREASLNYLAIKNQLTILMQYPDPLHEETKAEYSNLLGLWQEALELAAKTDSEDSTKSNTKKG